MSTRSLPLTRIHPLLSLFSALLLFPASRATAQTCDWSQTRKLIASDPAPGDEYGYPVAIWGDFVLVGAWHDDDHGPNSGSAYVYDRHTGDQLFKLTAADASAGAQFGYPITISHGVAIIGAVSDSELGHEAGAAYLFDVATGTQLRKLTAADAQPDDWFGVSVANSASLAIVGANQTDDDGLDSGSAYIFNADTGEQLWKLTAADARAGDWFGFDVEIDGQRALVGSRRSDAAGLNAGAVYVFDVATGEQLFRLTADDARIGAEFGRALALSGNVALIGANLDNHAGTASGAAYLFDVTTGEQLHRLTADDAAPSANFGVGVALHGNHAVVGAYGDNAEVVGSGAAYVFDVTTGQQIAKLKPDDPGYLHLFGIRVAIEDDTVVVGAWFDRHAGTGSGSAYVFDCPTCRADINADGMLDFFDVQTFLNAYAAGAASADWNSDGLYDFFDVQSFLNDYAAGCP